MAKDTREIVSGIEIPEGGVMRTFVSGQEDELEAVLTPAQVERLTGMGALRGDWSGKAKTAATLDNSRKRKVPTSQELSGAGPRTVAEPEEKETETKGHGHKTK